MRATVKVHHLRPAAGAKNAKTRVGRGEGSKGKTAGRGTKGTKARYQVPAGFEGGQMPLHMRAPKLKGFKNPFRVEYQVVNLDRLAELYPEGGEVTVGDLVAKGAVRKNEKVKVLGNGEITVALNVAVDKVSGSAEQKIARPAVPPARRPRDDLLLGGIPSERTSASACAVTRRHAQRVQSVRSSNIGRRTDVPRTLRSGSSRRRSALRLHPGLPHA